MFSKRHVESFLSLTTHLAALLEECIAAKNLNLGKLLHSLLLRTALNQNIYLVNRVIHMYSICGSLESAQRAFAELPSKNTHSYNTLLSSYVKYGLLENAHQLFVEIPKPNMVTYNSLISGLTHHGYHRDAIAVFRRMQQGSDTAFVDKFTLVGISSACANVKALRLLGQVHGVVIATGLELNVIMYNQLINAYGKCGDVAACRALFDQMPERDVLSWTSLLVAYTWANRLEEASDVFDRMPERNAVSWTALISGYAQNGHGGEALDVFRQMQEEGAPPCNFTYVSLLSACTTLALIECGKQIHTRIMRDWRGSGTFNIFLHNALIDMYAKCGDMKPAYSLFKEMPERDIVTWNSLVTGFAQNGQGKESLALFERMAKEGVRPNHVTFLGVLSACSHAGLVSEGHHLLRRMQMEYGVCPTPEHYAILVDGLGRKNQLDEAVELIEKTDGVTHKVGMWGALLGACRVHGKLEHATRAAESLFHLEPTNGARYVVLSNVYAAAGRWEDARRVRALMKEKMLKKETAQSWIEVRNTRHGFVAEDKSHECTKEIYDVLAKLTFKIKEAEYLPNNDQFFSYNGESLVSLS